MASSHIPSVFASEPAATRTPLLRGSASKARGLAAGNPESASLSWDKLGEHRVAVVEGNGLFTVHGDLDLCKQVCSNYHGCTSFAFCSGTCYLKDGDVSASSPSRANDFCTTYFLSATPPAATTTTPPEPEASSQAECYPLEAALQVNQAQHYEGNPESDATGTVELLLCTNGTMMGNLTVEGGRSEIIATHIHHCEGGDSPQTRTGVLCSGSPVINFCGDNAAGLIADGTDYTAPCAPFDGSSASRTGGMLGAVVEGKSAGMTVAERVQDIAAYPDKYYFNVHTAASYNHYYPHHEGMCRGPLQGRSLEATTTTTPAPAAAAPSENRCYSLFSQVSLNELQKYPSNPDSAASGYADFMMCTNGTLKATAFMFGGVSDIIAMHIHRCEGGTTPQTKTADLCTGPPVVNFCGDNAAGLIADGAKYPEGCAPWGRSGSSRTADMSGVMVSGDGSSSSVAQLVQDIVDNPKLYYFNVHTEASYMHWYPHHNGMCRGPMQLSSN